MKTGQATGLQIAFLMLAVMLIAVPLTNFVVTAAQLTGVGLAFAEKGMHFALAALIIAAFPKLRAFAATALSTPIPRPMRAEVALVALAKLSQAFATAGALAVWFWWTQGAAGVERMAPNPDHGLAKAYSDAGLVRLVMAALVAPVVEELVFRGFIYRAFERQWGWVLAMLATSAIFGLYHVHFWNAFAGSIVFVCLLRRTGSIWAPILAHMLFNFMMWWPLLGQYVFPTVALTDPRTWILQLACLSFVLVALPIYVWMSRDRNVVAPTVFLQPDAPLSK